MEGLRRRVYMDPRLASHKNLLADGPRRFWGSVRVPWGLDDVFLKLLGSKCPDLVELNAHRGVSITDTGVAHLAAGCRSLEHVALIACGLTDAGLATLATGCPAITFLDISKCKEITDAGLSSIAASCTSLKSLNLFGCTRVTDAGIEFLIGCSGRCPFLHDLNIHCCSVSPEMHSRLEDKDIWV